MSKSLIYVDGNYVSPEEARVSVFDRGFLYGDSIYEVTLTYQKKPLMLDEHLDRLWNSAARLMMPMPWSREDLTEKILTGIKQLGFDRQYIRLVITRGAGEIGLDPSLALESNLIIIFKELERYPKEWYTNGVHMIVADVLRNSKKAVDPSIKSGNYLNNIMAMTQAKKVGAYDAIMLNHKGHVTEGTTNNLWMVKDGIVKTPPLQAGLLGGITRKKLLELCKQHGIEALESDFTATEMKEADEAFLTSSTKELVPIFKIDDQLIGDGKPGPIWRNLLDFYRDHVHKSLELH